MVGGEVDVGGMVVGLIALGIFVVFSGWVVAERLRSNRQAPPRIREDQVDD